MVFYYPGLGVSKISACRGLRQLGASSTEFERDERNAGVSPTPLFTCVYGIILPLLIMLRI